jgi:hypothetical protein
VNLGPGGVGDLSSGIRFRADYRQDIKDLKNCEVHTILYPVFGVPEFVGRVSVHGEEIYAQDGDGVPMDLPKKVTLDAAIIAVIKKDQAKYNK